MLEKYLNKEVVIEEKLYQLPSTVGNIGMMKMSMGAQNNRITGTITAIDDEFVELDNTSLVSRKFIYRISLK